MTALQQDDFSDLIAAPSEDDVIMLIKSFFDESYDKGLLCVGGYTFTSRKARELDADWRRMLRLNKGLPYFRMSACNARQDPFDRLTESECVAVATEAIRLINKYATIGFAVTVDQSAFYKIVTRKGFVSTPYEFCAWLCLVAVRAEIDQFVEPGPMSFFFEAGFKDQKPANRMMDNIFHTPNLRKLYRYKQHAFVDKAQARPIQTADLLSWQWYKAATRLSRGIIKPRGDLVELLSGTPHFVVHADAGRLQQMVDAINARAGSPIGNEIAGIAMINPSSPLFPKRPGEFGSQAAYEDLKARYPERFKGGV